MHEKVHLTVIAWIFIFTASEHQQQVTLGKSSSSCNTISVIPVFSIKTEMSFLKEVPLDLNVIQVKVLRQNGTNAHTAWNQSLDCKKSGFYGSMTSFAPSNSPVGNHLNLCLPGPIFLYCSLIACYFIIYQPWVLSIYSLQYQQGIISLIRK